MEIRHACGENPRGVYGNSRMDNIWAFREIYDKARKIKEEQDLFCEKTENGHWAGLGEFPEELQYEALVDVLRGRVKVNVHCYEPVDLDDLVRVSFTRVSLYDSILMITGYSFPMNSSFLSLPSIMLMRRISFQICSDRPMVRKN